MALLTVDDVKKANGQASLTLTPDQTDQIQYYIDAVSAYIESTTGVTFGQIVGETFRFKSDEDGDLYLPLWPIQAVTAVVRVSDPDSVFPYYWDGLQEIRRLRAQKAYDVTLNYGYYPVPADIMGVAVESVRRGVSAGPTGIKTKTVGDVSYDFGSWNSFDPADVQIINSYGDQEGTLKLPWKTDVRERWSGVINGFDCDNL